MACSGLWHNYTVLTHTPSLSNFTHTHTHTHTLTHTHTHTHTPLRQPDLKPHSSETGMKTVLPVFLLGARRGLPQSSHFPRHTWPLQLQSNWSRCCGEINWRGNGLIDLTLTAGMQWLFVTHPWGQIFTRLVCSCYVVRKNCNVFVVYCLLTICCTLNNHVWFPKESLSKQFVKYNFF